MSRAKERGGVSEKVGRESGVSEARERREFGEKEWLDICEIGVGELSDWMNKRERMISVASILGYSIQQGSEMRGLSKRVERVESRRGWVWVVRKYSERACWVN